MKKYILALATVAAMASCNGKIDFGPNEGVTHRNAMNLPQGYTDESDWTQDGKWNKKETALFSNDLNNIDVNAAQAGGISGLSFFANPVQLGGAGYFNYLATPTGIRLHAVFVDKKYSVLTRSDLPVTNGSRYGTTVAFDFPEDKFKDKEVYRFYYVFYAPNGTLHYKGHGDIKIGR